MEKLRVLFIGYSEIKPVCFIFCGNFLSNNSGHRSLIQLKGYVLALYKYFTLTSLTLI